MMDDFEFFMTFEFSLLDYFWMSLGIFASIHSFTDVHRFYPHQLAKETTVPSEWWGIEMIQHGKGGPMD